MNLFDSQEVRFDIELDSELLERLGMNREDKLDEVLRAGIEAAREGKKSEARRLLFYVVNSQPDNEAVWLWLASVSEYPEELLYFLKNVLRINPSNQKALEWQRSSSALIAKNFIQRGINAYKMDRKELAKQFFEEAIRNDEENELAWLWLASVVESEREKISCLEKVLQINPENETAKNSLDKIRQQKARELLKQANAAVIAGKGSEAYIILEELMKFDSEIEEAWLLKAYLATSYEEKLQCFEKVLSLNPENEIAQTGVEALREMKEESKTQVSDREDLNVSDEISSEEAMLERPRYSETASIEGEFSEESANKNEEDSEASLQQSFQPEQVSSDAETSSSSSVEEAIADEHQLAEEISESEEQIMTEVFDERGEKEVEHVESRGNVILVVDDSQTIRKLIATKLGRLGYRVIEASNGLEALQKLNEVIPDLILLDITMPGLDGYEVCKRIRSSEATKDIPVVMISGRDGFFDKVKGRMVGSSGYITKPFGPETLMSTVESYLKDVQK